MRTIRLISLNIKDALRRTEWLILKSFYENHIENVCSVDELGLGANASYPATEIAIFELIEKGFITRIPHDYLQLTELALTERIILVRDLREHDNDNSEIPTFGRTLAKERAYLDYEVLEDKVSA